jgi:hypothetical protein
LPIGVQQPVILHGRRHENLTQTNEGANLVLTNALIKSPSFEGNLTRSNLPLAEFDHPNKNP